MFLMNISVLFQTQADFPYFYHFIYSGKIGSLEEFCFSFCLCSIFHTKNNFRLPRCSSLHSHLNSNWHSDVLRGMNSKIVLKVEAFKFLKKNAKKIRELLLKNIFGGIFANAVLFFCFPFTSTCSYYYETRLRIQ